MPIGDIYTVSTFFDFQGQTNNVYLWHMFTNDDADTSTNEHALNEYFEDTVLPAFVVGLDENFIFKCIDTKLVIDESVKDPVTSISQQIAVNLAGSVTTAEALPGQCSMVIQTIDELSNGDPSSRGRDFYTGFVEGDQADGVWIDATLAARTGILNTVLKPSSILKNGGQWFWVNLSPKRIAARKAGGGPPFVKVFADIEFLRPLKAVRTQRRRQFLNPCDKFGVIVDLDP